jgi:haloacetate dehalogenase
MTNGNPLAYLHAKLGGWGSANMDCMEHAALAVHSRN